MNKKIMILTITILTLIMVTTPLIGTSYGLGKPKIGETFTLDPTSDPPTTTNWIETVPPNEKFVSGGNHRLAWGAVREADYDGELGHGLFTIETVHSEGWAPDDSLIGHGHGVYKYTLEIEVGTGYGTGTLEGTAFLTWKVDWSVMPPVYEQWTSVVMLGKGELKGLKVFVETYGTALSPITFEEWWVTTTIVDKT